MMEILFEGKVGITMAKGHENLIPTSKRTKEEARALGQAGGIKSGIARRRTKTMREALKVLLQIDTQDAERAEALRALGLEPSYLNSLQLTMVSKAEAGDVEAFRAVRDTSGEKPAQAVDMQVTDRPFEALELRSLSDQDLAQLADGGGAGVVSGDDQKG